ncbi:hypothetical protein [Sphingomicrobium astaxanthinifaciens]|uniref:hypothetical protein n=1 Tax=Sphingomicrobium astaxanthinifaciens TaxID=1227949 RepID=UPI001FCCB288|nr:hypothetical protein [Sphingomicrobium astaxanthinifaciens]MCJ7420627.1 hypothetical protein [Sphingomicrobium astaxanthinifaciens]
MAMCNSGWLFAGAGSLLALSAAVAAPETPESLLPPGFETPPPAPTSPPRPAPSRPVPEPRDRSVAGSDPIADPIEEPSVQALEGEARADTAPTTEEAPDALETAGVFAASNAAFGFAGEAPWGTVEGLSHKTLMRRLDVPLASRWGHIALRNALLAEAPAPREVEMQDWLAERAWLLLRMGEADAARLLLAGTDPDRFSAKLAQVALQVALATADPAAACPVAPRLDDAEPDAEPLVRAMCAALSAQPEIASDAIARARRGGEADAIDLALVDKLVGAGAGTGRAVTLEWDSVDRLNSWRFGLAGATGLLPPDRLMQGARPRVAAWAARAPLLTSSQRLPFARTATGLGVFSGQALVDLYAVDYDYLPPEERGASEAFQLRRTFVARSEADRIAAMRDFWSIGEGPHERLASRAATALAAAQITPSDRHADAASDLIAAMLTSGFVEQAAAWGPTIVAMDEAEADSAWAQLVLALPQVDGLGLGADRLRDFVARDEADGKPRSAMLVAMLAGLGRIDPALASRISDDEKFGLDGETRLTRMLDAAAARGEGATVILLAATALQAADIDGIPPLYLRHIVAALVAVEQDFLARMIAAEAIARL